MSVTVQLSASSYRKPMFTKGQIISIGGQKRIKMVINEVIDSYQSTDLTCKSGYMAAPKSKLRSQTVFSKVKSPILNKLLKTA
jgi:hypothetical protein